MRLMIVVRVNQDSKVVGNQAQRRLKLLSVFTPSKTFHKTNYVIHIKIYVQQLQ